mgnify:FL=1
MIELTWLDPSKLEFPPVEQAMQDPDGLLAVGGDLSKERLLLAYSKGIFPWYEDDQPLLWWSPDPRAVIEPQNVKISRSLRKRLRKREFEVRVDTAFDDVVKRCQNPRAYSNETWITNEMRQAYLALHRDGYAHSIECYQDKELVGGLYGVSIGRLFFGESMFHAATDASKVAFVALCRLLRQQGCPLVDCQMPNPHIMSLGVETISRSEFMLHLLNNNKLKSNEWINWPSLQGAMCVDTRELADEN